MRFKLALVLGALGVALFALPASGALGAEGTQNYVVEMAEFPVVSYTGGVSGLAATKPGKGQKIDPNSNGVKKYFGHLVGKHDKALERAGGGKKLYDYGYTFNGFAAELTEEQAAKLSALKGVVAVTPDEKLQLDTSSTPAFLGLTAQGGLWEQLGGTGTANPSPNATGAGEGVIVGIIDGGIWPEHPSVSDRINGKLVYQQIPGWHGKCTPGEEFNASMCNKKLIGAQYYNAAWGGNAAIDAQFPWEFNSPRDFGGHGTHTATTAAGNYGIKGTGPSAVFTQGSNVISGVAPRARIAAYKTCWETGGGGACFSSDSVAAIDQAVADGVDVLNYSISGSRTNFRDPVEIAFLFAADAGVFVAASAGNSGPASSTVAHPGPWLTTVAAGTHNRDGQGSVTLGNGVTYTGSSVATSVGPAPLIDSVNAGLAGAPAGDVELCVPGTLDPAKVTGKIVVCKRGVIARVDKSRAVQMARGVGMILYNDPDSSLNADFHFVPTVHVNRASGLAIKAYAATANATAKINQATIVTNAPAPFTASFSSRGPLQAGNGDLLKPDVIAPGQDVLAGVAPPGNSGRLFDLYSGTSMSSPHVAGLGALLKHKYPSWSPMAIKSALMTSGYDVLDSASEATRIFRQGAGHVRPNNAADPGLVFDNGFTDWLNFICGTQPGSFCSAFTPIDPSDLNVASIAIGDLAGTQTVTRRVTNVSGQAESYTASVSGLTGVNAVVSSLGSIGAGETKPFTVAFTATTAALNAYVGGQLTLRGDKGHVVRIPLVVRPVALAAPTEVSSTGGAISYNVKFGYTGSFSATARGLVPAAVTPGTVADDPTDGACTNTSAADKVRTTVAVPAGTTYARFSLFDADVAPGADIDLCVFSPAGQLVGSSAGATSAEEVNLLAPAAGTYNVVVHGWGVSGTSPFRLHTWVLGSTAAGNMTVTAPASATLGATGTINLTFSGLTAGTKYLGSVAYGGAAVMPNPTIVRVNP